MRTIQFTAGCNDMAGHQHDDIAMQAAARRAGCDDQKTQAEWDAIQALRFRNRLEDDHVRETLRLCRAQRPEKCKPVA